MSKQRTDIIKKVNTLPVKDSCIIGDYKITRSNRMQYTVIRGDRARSYNASEMTEIVNTILKAIEQEESMLTNRQRKRRMKETNKKSKTVRVSKRQLSKLNKARTKSRVMKTIINVLFQLVLLVAVFGLIHNIVKVDLNNATLLIVTGGLALLSILINFVATRRLTKGFKVFNIVFSTLLLITIVGFLFVDKAFVFANPFTFKSLLTTVKGRPDLLFTVSTFINLFTSLLATKTKE